MTDKPRNYEDELASIMNAMAESSLELADDEVEAEIMEEGGDPEVVAERVKFVLRAALESCRQRPLLEAQKKYDTRIATMEAKEFAIPSSLEEQRQMLGHLLTAYPQLNSGLVTAQFREFGDLADEDVELCLKQLLELTAESDLTNPKEGEP